MGKARSFSLFALSPLAGLICLSHAVAEEKFSIDAYMMEEAREVALAKSAAPSFVSDDASVFVLRESGYEQTIEGTNGYVCLVLRSWGESSFDADLAYDPTTLDPECMDAESSKTILPMQLYRAELGLSATPPMAIKSSVQRAFASGRLKRIETVGFSYMMSLGMTKHRPHIMFYMPDGWTNTSFANSSEGAPVVIVIGGDDEPYIAAVIPQRDRGIAPNYP